MIKPMKRPEYLNEGELARLIPVVADSHKEARATSILLANLMAVHEFAENVFSSIGLRIGKRTKVQAYTEVCFKKKPKDLKLRPDGLIVVDTGKTQWRALVEAKIDSEELKENQVKDYISLAKQNGIDAVITISNQYSATPKHHPLNMKKSDMKGVDLFHWSWMSLYTEAILLIKAFGVNDEDQHFILNEMLRYFGHKSSGLLKFEKMNAEWKDVASKIKSGANFSKTDDNVEKTVVSWHQLSRNLCFILSRKIEVPVSLKLSRNHINNPATRIKEDCEKLAKGNKLECEIDVPDAASPILLSADMLRRTITCSMRVNAPKDKKRATARVNWLLRQLKDVNNEDVYIKAVTHGRSEGPQDKLSVIREDDGAITTKDGTSIMPLAFEVMINKDIAGRFSGRKTFIQDVEETLMIFYSQVGENLKTWVADAPKVKKHDKSEGDFETAILDEQKVA